MNALPLSWPDIIGTWVGIFLTLAILSFLYKDNPFYKLAEHLFVGTSIGIVIIQSYYNTLKPNLIVRIWDDHKWSYLIAAALMVMLFLRLASRRIAWVGRYPVAFIVGIYAGLNIPSIADSDLISQTKAATADLIKEQTNINTAPAAQLRKLPGFGTAVADKVVARREQKPFTEVSEVEDLEGLSPRQHTQLSDKMSGPQGIKAQAFAGAKGEKHYYWFGMFSALLMLLGTIASLIYFYFSVPHKGVVGKVARFGTWILMIGFGASFGYTVQGRISLAIGRAFDLLDQERTPLQKSQIHGPWVSLISMIIIIGGLIYFEKRPAKKPPTDSGGVTPEELPPF